MSENSNPKSTNIWDVLLSIVNNIFALLNNGKIFPAILLAIIVAFLKIIFSMSNEELTSCVVSFLASDETILVGIGLFALFIISNGIWIVLYRNKKKLYLEEIQRLTQNRSELLHGRERSDSPLLNTHTSTTQIGNESYIFPVNENENENENEHEN